MKLKTSILALLVLSAFLAGCASNQAGYSTYNQQQGQQQPYVGGGCGVAPSGDYEDAPVNALKPANSGL